jgi:hypothetical protein
VTGPPPPDVFESPDFIVVIPKSPETSATLATRYLGDVAKAWMIEEYTGSATFAPGQQAVIPRKPWNPAGVTASDPASIGESAEASAGATSGFRQTLAQERRAPYAYLGRTRV